MSSPLSGPAAWDLVCHAYTRVLAPHAEQYATDALQLAALPPGCKIIDVAAGPGTFSFLAAKRGCRVTAVDFSPAMIELLVQRARREGWESLIEARVANGEDLPYAESTFDAAFSMFGLMFFGDRARGLRELHRVLVPGGCALSSSWGSLEEVPPIAAFFSILRRALPELEIPPAPALLSSPELVESEMIAGGFSRVEVHTLSHDLIFESPDDFWESFGCSAAPAALIQKRVGVQRWQEISRGAIEGLTEMFGGGQLAIPMPAHLGIAWKHAD